MKESNFKRVEKKLIIKMSDGTSIDGKIMSTTGTYSRSRISDIISTDEKFVAVFDAKINKERTINTLIINKSHILYIVPCDK